MENRYLFKAKRVDNGEWVTGYYVKGLDMYDKEVHLIFDPATIFYSNGETDGWNEIDPPTICQCTGLKDKNGNLIWENDIVFVTDDDGCSGQIDTGVGEIDFLDGLWYISGNVQNALYDIDKCFQLEVIGNIFDNKELLESEV